MFESLLLIVKIVLKLCFFEMFKISGVIFSMNGTLIKYFVLFSSLFLVVLFNILFILLLMLEKIKGRGYP